MAKKDKKQKQKKGEASAAEPGAMRVIAHPRAATSIRRWRGRAGLIALVVVTLLSMRVGVPAFDAVLRGLAGGVAAQFVAWAAGVIAWRHLIIAEVVVHREARAVAVAKRREAIEQRAAGA